MAFDKWKHEEVGLVDVGGGNVEGDEDRKWPE